MFSHIGKTLYFVEINVCIEDNNYIIITKYMKRLYNVYNTNFFFDKTYICYMLLDPMNIYVSIIQ